MLKLRLSGSNLESSSPFYINPGAQVKVRMWLGVLRLLLYGWVSMNSLESGNKFSNIVKSWSESANYVLLNCCVILCLSPFPSHLEMITLWLWYTKHTNIHTGLHAWDPRRGVSKLECIYQNMNTPWLEVNTFRLCLSISLRLHIVFVPLVSCHLASIGTHMNTHTH